MSRLSCLIHAENFHRQVDARRDIASAHGTYLDSVVHNSRKELCPKPDDSK